MITVGMHYDVREGKDKEFEGAFGTVLALLRKTEGHTLSKLYHEVEKPRAYMIYSEWESMEAFRDFMKSDAFRQTADWGKSEILEGRPRHSIWKGAVDK